MTDEPGVAQVGATFRGRNRIGQLGWTTVPVVTRAEPGRAFAFDVPPPSRSSWLFEIEPDPGGCRVTGAVAARRPGAYQLQAVIASCRANARRAADTDWRDRAGSRHLLDHQPSPVVRLNHAVAVAMADGPAPVLALLGDIVGLERCHLLHATRGDLLARSGDAAGARAAFATARSLTATPAEQRLLERRVSELA